jgi:tetratricopeptide (TPR) repeat protein
MRKNNTSKSISASSNHAGEKPASKSIPSKKVNNGTATRSIEYGDPKRRPRNSTWIKALDQNPEMRELYQRAIDLKHAGKLKEAAVKMEEAVEEFPQFPILWWYLGALYLHDLKKPRKAIPYLRRATELSPKSERASLGLFHSLWSANQVNKALEELKRYQQLTNWSCRDYLQIVDEIDRKWPPNPKTRKTKTKKKVAP